MRKAGSSFLCGPGCASGHRAGSRGFGNCRSRCGRDRVPPSPPRLALSSLSLPAPTRNRARPRFPETALSPHPCLLQVKREHVLCPLGRHSHDLVLRPHAAHVDEALRGALDLPPARVRARAAEEAREAGLEAEGGEEAGLRERAVRGRWGGGGRRRGRVRVRASSEERGREKGGRTKLAHRLGEVAKVDVGRQVRVPRLGQRVHHLVLAEALRAHGTITESRQPAAASQRQHRATEESCERRTRQLLPNALASP